MKVLVIGKGGREHSIVRALKKSPEITKLYCAPGNAGTACDAINLPIKDTDKKNMSEFAVNEGIEFAVVVPDNPLACGMVDALEEVGVPCFGPNARAAHIEASKVFSKHLMKKYNIPTGDYEVFIDSYKAIKYVKDKNTYPTVIKADGLALGKGVIIANNFSEAEAAIKTMMIDGKFGESGKQIIIEEFLTGPEVSILCFTDGKTIKPMISSMDHKCALDGDKGLNTGGMGAVAPNPAYTPKIAAECMKKIFIPTIEAMESEGRPFSGCLYFGLIITSKGPKMIEYNCRFGDPEAQTVLSLLKTDLFTIMRAVREKYLKDVDVIFSNDSSACVVMAAPGYPTSYPKGILIKNLNKDGQIDGSDVTVYHAGTIFENGEFKTSGGRVLCVTATDCCLKKAIEKAYSNIKKISFDGAHYRTDIGQKALNILNANKTVKLENCHDDNLLLKTL